MVEPLHRFEDDYWSQSEWKQMPESGRRVRRVLGGEPLPDRRHLLPAVAAPAPLRPLPRGPHPGTSLVVDIAGADPITTEALAHALSDPGLNARLADAALWGFIQGSWQLLTRAALGRTGAFTVLTLAWEQVNLPGNSLAEVEAAAQRCLDTADALARVLGARVTHAPAPADTAREAARLIRLKDRFAHSVELRWRSTAAPLPARHLWRTVYSLGFAWGHLDLFYWPAAPQPPLFTLTNAEKPGYFLPERALEGESVPGFVLSFELPACPVPVETFDCMALALVAFQEILGGRVTDGGGRELDGERLDAERSVVVEAVAQLTAAGIRPGSAEARAFF